MKFILLGSLLLLSGCLAQTLSEQLQSVSDLVAASPGVDTSALFPNCNFPECACEGVLPARPRNPEQSYSAIVCDENDITELRLQAAGLTAFPAGFDFNFPKLKRLDLDLNNFASPIPTSLNGVNLPSLEILELRGNGFTGEIPTELSTLLNLKKLHLQSNKLTGSPSFNALNKLEELLISKNNFDGALPTYPNLADTLKLLDVSDNDFDGSIPDFVGHEYLRALSVSGNRLSGTIPPLKNHQSLELLHVHDNFFTGQLFDEFHTLPNLKILNFRDNNFTGQFPMTLDPLVFGNKLQILRGRSWTRSGGNTFDCTMPNYEKWAEKTDWSHSMACKGCNAFGYTTGDTSTMLAPELVESQTGFLSNNTVLYIAFKISKKYDRVEAHLDPTDLEFSTETSCHEKSIVCLDDKSLGSFWKVIDEDECWITYQFTAEFNFLVDKTNNYGYFKVTGDTTDPEQIFLGQLVIGTTNKVAIKAGEVVERQIISQLPFKVALPRRITSSSSGDVYNVPDVKMALISQRAVKTQIATVLKIGLLITVTNPFIVSNDNFHSSWNLTAGTVNSVALTNLISGSNINACQFSPAIMFPLGCPYFEATVEYSMPAALCEVDGTFDISFAVDCFPSFAAACPVTGAFVTNTLHFTTSSCL